MQSKAFGEHLRACSNSYQLCEGALGGGEAAQLGWRVGWAEVSLGGDQPRTNVGRTTG